MTSLVLCFYQTDYIQNIVNVLGATNPFSFVALFVGLQGLVEAAVCWLISGILCRALYPVLYRNTTAKPVAESASENAAAPEQKPEV